MKALILIAVLFGSTAFGACPNLSGKYCAGRRHIIITQQACDIVDLDDPSLMSIFRNVNVKDDVKIKETFLDGTLWSRLHYGAVYTKTALELFEISYFAKNPQKVAIYTNYSLVNGNLEVVTSMVGAAPKVETLSPCP